MADCPWRRLAVGDRLLADEMAYVVLGFEDGAVKVRDARGSVIQRDLDDLRLAADFTLLDAPGPATKKTDGIEVVDRDAAARALPRHLVKAAEELRAHILEARFGYRTGCEWESEPGEPRDGYDPSLFSWKQRREAKAREIGRHPDSIKRYWAALRDHGLAGLIDDRYVPTLRGLESLNDKVRDAVLTVARQRRGQSRISKRTFRDLTRRLLDERHGVGVVELPGATKFNSVLGNGLGDLDVFTHSSRTQRSRDSAPPTPWREFAADVPGQTVVLDEHVMDILVLDPITFKTVLRPRLIVAYDLCTKTPLAARMCPYSVKAVDVSMLLADAVSPTPMRPEWPESCAWWFHEIPDEVLADLAGAVVGRPAAIPIMRIHELVLDGAKNFRSINLRETAVLLGADIVNARPYTATDKAPLERFFGALNSLLIERLPGYVGPDTRDRGPDQPDIKAIQDGPLLLMQQLEEILAHWLVRVWQNRPHEGIVLPFAPHLQVSPNTAYQMHLQWAGATWLPYDPDLYQKLLPVHWRKLHPKGATIHRLWFDASDDDAAAFDTLRGRRSPYGGVNRGKWPLRLHPRDNSRAFLFSPEDERWLTLPWRGGDGLAQQPFGEAMAAYCKAEARRRGATLATDDEVDAWTRTILREMEGDLFANAEGLRRASEQFQAQQRLNSDRMKLHRPDDIDVPDDPEANVDGGFAFSRTVEPMALAR